MLTPPERCVTNCQKILKLRPKQFFLHKFCAPQNADSEMIDNFSQKLTLQYIQWSFSSKLFILT